MKKYFNEFNEKIHKVCLVALHACADLTVDMLKLSLSMECLNAAIVMPCCYHRLKEKPQVKNEILSFGRYVNFPLSNELNGLIEDEDQFLNGTFLRLACQRADWKNRSIEQRDIQTNNLMFRNILQLVADEGTSTQ